MSGLHTLFYLLAAVVGGGLLGYLADLHQSRFLGLISFACIPLAIFVFMWGFARHD